jgi:hypothetical protein
VTAWCGYCGSQTHPKPEDELARLRERVGELEKEISSNCAVAMERGLQLRQKIERERLLMQLLRWCLARGVMSGQVWDCKSESFVYGIRACGGAFGEPIEPPPEFAPLIAEAVKQQKEQSNGT